MIAVTIITIGSTEIGITLFGAIFIMVLAIILSKPSNHQHTYRYEDEPIAREESSR